jgi:hypothetical protein
VGIFDNVNVRKNGQALLDHLVHDRQKIRSFSSVSMIESPTPSITVSGVAYQWKVVRRLNFTVVPLDVAEESGDGADEAKRGGDAADASIRV